MKDKNKDQKTKWKYGLNPGGKCIYIGNLNYNIREKNLYNLFGRFGKVKFVSLIMQNNKSKGIAFVDMYDAKCADEAIKALDNTRYADRMIKVSQAQEKNFSKTKEAPVKQEKILKKENDILAKRRKNQRQKKGFQL